MCVVSLVMTSLSCSSTVCDSLNKERKGQSGVKGG